jgi:ribonuclease HII
MATRSQLKKRLDFDEKLYDLLANAPSPSHFHWPLKQTPIWALANDDQPERKTDHHLINPAPVSTGVTSTEHHLINPAPVSTGATGSSIGVASSVGATPCVAHSDSGRQVFDAAKSNRDGRHRMSPLQTDHDTNVQELAAGTKIRAGQPVLIGLDEVGRGSLAGPVVAAAVVLPYIAPRSKEAKALAKINDSKLVPKEERERLAEIITSIAQVAIAEASVEEIDTINILQASLLAMKRARQKLNLPGKSVLAIDGNKHIANITDIQIAVVKGDLLSASIAAASIVAKVYRDKLMADLSKDYPHYQWQSNKGYGSAEHRQAINDHGQCVWHRKSFVLKSAIEDEDE